MAPGSVMFPLQRAAMYEHAVLLACPVMTRQDVDLIGGAAPQLHLQT
jgi:hypothetical protein